MIAGCHILSSAFFTSADLNLWRVKIVFSCLNTNWYGSRPFVTNRSAKTRPCCVNCAKPFHRSNGSHWRSFCLDFRPCGAEHRLNTLWRVMCGDCGQHPSLQTPSLQPHCPLADPPPMHCPAGSTLMSALVARLGFLMFDHNLVLRGQMCHPTPPHMRSPQLLNSYLVFFRLWDCSVLFMSVDGRPWLPWCALVWSYRNWSIRIWCFAPEVSVRGQLCLSFLVSLHWHADNTRRDVLTFCMT